MASLSEAANLVRCPRSGPGAVQRDDRRGPDAGRHCRRHGIGAVILGAMRDGLTLLDVQAFYQLLATGLIILTAMLSDRATRGRG